MVMKVAQVLDAAEQYGIACEEERGSSGPKASAAFAELEAAREKCRRPVPNDLIKAAETRGKNDVRWRDKALEVAPYAQQSPQTSRG